MPNLKSAFVALALTATPSLAFAGPLTPTDILTQFNLTVFGSMDSSSNVQGRTFVGGSLAGQSDYFTRGSQVAASTFGALTVGGSIGGGWKNINNGGNVTVGGNAQNLNMNGGGTARIGGSYSGPFNQGTKITGATVDIPTDFKSTLGTWSDNISDMDANSSINVAYNRATFNAAPVGGVAVFDIADGASFFNSIGEIAFNRNGATTMVINIGGLTMNIAENFLGGIGSSIAANTIWNFYDATNITFSNAFFGAVLATDAAVTNYNTLMGSIAVNSLTQRGGVELAAYSGVLPSFAQPVTDVTDVPEPATAALLLLGVAGTLMARRRFRKTQISA